LLLSYAYATRTARLQLTQRSFFIKYYSKAFSTLPGIAGGLAGELFNVVNNVPHYKTNQIYQRDEIDDIDALNVPHAPNDLV